MKYAFQFAPDSARKLSQNLDQFSGVRSGIGDGLDDFRGALLRYGPVEGLAGPLVGFSVNREADVPVAATLEQTPVGHLITYSWYHPHTRA